MSEITVALAAPRSVASIGALRGSPPLVAALQAEFGVAPPAAQGFIQSAEVTLSCLSASRYLASGPRDANLPARLAHIAAGLGAVTDQSDLWQSFTLTGTAVRDTLARLLPVDTDPDIFRIGALALTRALHVDVRLWRLAANTYELAVPRSYCDYVAPLLWPEEIVLF